jgi:hypothetical protein
MSVVQCGVVQRPMVKDYGGHNSILNINGLMH